jgi:hypothetical protein
MRHQQFDTLIITMGVEILVAVRGRAAPPLRVILAGGCLPLAIFGGVGLSRSTILVTKGTEHAGSPRRLLWCLP